MLDSPSEIPVAPPPRADSAAAKSDVRELNAAVEERTAEQEKRAREQNAKSVVDPWLGRAMALVSQREKNPPAASRSYGFVAVAMHDAAVAAYHWMYRYNRKAPESDPLVTPGSDPSYPSAGAAIAGAASRVLSYLYPEVPQARFDQDADDAARLRVVAGTSYPSDADAGLKLGRAIGEKVVAHATRDGSTREWNGKRPREGPRARRLLQDRAQGPRQRDALPARQRASRAAHGGLRNRAEHRPVRLAQRGEAAAQHEGGVSRASHGVRRLEATLGDQNYLLPRDVDASKLRSIVIWCEPVQIAYTAATLTR